MSLADSQIWPSPPAIMSIGAARNVDNLNPLRLRLKRQERGDLYIVGTIDTLI